MCVAIGVFIWLASESRRKQGLGRTANSPPVSTARIPEERYELLSRFVPPVYQAGTSPQSKAFQQAMELYRKGDDAGALAGLRQAAEAQPDSVEVRFYLGIVLLLTNNRVSGIEELRRVVAAGDTPYLERSRFFLAKALIGAHDIVDAEQQLKDVIAMHGEFQKQAEFLRAQISPGH